MVNSCHDILTPAFQSGLAWIRIESLRRAAPTSPMKLRPLFAGLGLAVVLTLSASAQLSAAPAPATAPAPAELPSAILAGS